MLHNYKVLLGLITHRSKCNLSHCHYALEFRRASQGFILESKGTRRELSSLDLESAVQLHFNCDIAWS